MTTETTYQSRQLINHAIATWSVSFANKKTSFSSLEVQNKLLQKKKDKMKEQVVCRLSVSQIFASNLLRWIGARSYDLVLVLNDRYILTKILESSKIWSTVTVSSITFLPIIQKRRESTSTLVSQSLLTLRNNFSLMRDHHDKMSTKINDQHRLLITDSEHTIDLSCVLYTA